MGNTTGRSASDVAKLQGVALAAYQGDAAQLRTLITTNKKFDKKDKFGRTPLSWASYNGHTECVKILQEAGSEIDPIDTTDGSSPLQNAVRADHMNVVKFLLSVGARTDIKDNESRTALHFAAHSGDVKMGTLLLANKAPVDAKDQEGRTPLHWATFNAHADFVRLLLQNQAAVNVKDNAGRTCIIYAAHLGHVSVCKVLLQFEADPLVTDNQGMRPLEHARYNEHQDCVTIVQDAISERASREEAQDGPRLDERSLAEESKAAKVMQVTVWDQLRSQWYRNELQDTPCWCEPKGQDVAQLGHVINDLRDQVRRLEDENTELLNKLREAAEAADPNKAAAKTMKFKNQIADLKKQMKQMQRAKTIIEIELDTAKGDLQRQLNKYTDLEIKYEQARSEVTALTARLAEANAAGGGAGAAALNDSAPSTPMAQR